MVVARPGFEKAMVGTRWATPRPDCMDRLRKHYSHHAEGWYLARKAAVHMVAARPGFEKAMVAY